MKRKRLNPTMGFVELVHNLHLVLLSNAIMNYEHQIRNSSR